MKWKILLCILIVFVLSACKRFYINIGEEFASELWEERPEGIACVPISAVNPIDNNELTFNENHLLCVDIQMNVDSFEQMRYESRFGPDVRLEDGTIAVSTALQFLFSCDVSYPNEYNWYSADVTIDEVSVGNVGIRKKGFLGSIFSTSPSIKIITDRYEPNQKIGATSRVTFNNNSEDPSRIIQCLKYKVFEDANYPAPRCNLANISVNGEALGIYTHIEAIDEQFLVRSFGNSNGDLYEGQLIDFIPEWLPRWDAKTDATDENGQPILDLADVLRNAPDSTFINDISQHINLDNFIQFWALEILLNHTDGYCLNRNNFFIYFNPNDNNRATFIPWGMNGLALDEPEAIRFVEAEIPRRLSRIPETATMLENEITRLLTNVWNEDDLMDLIDNYAVQVQTGEDNPSYAGVISILKDWVNNRRTKVQEIMADGLREGKEFQVSQCTGY